MPSLPSIPRRGRPYGVLREALTRFVSKSPTAGVKFDVVACRYCNKAGDTIQSATPAQSIFFCRPGKLRSHATRCDDLKKNKEDYDRILLLIPRKKKEKGRRSGEKEEDDANDEDTDDNDEEEEGSEIETVGSSQITSSASSLPSHFHAIKVPSAALDALALSFVMKNNSDRRLRDAFFLFAMEQLRPGYHSTSTLNRRSFRDEWMEGKNAEVILRTNEIIEKWTSVDQIARCGTIIWDGWKSGDKGSWWLLVSVFNDKVYLLQLKEWTKESHTGELICSMAEEGKHATVCLFLVLTKR